MGVASSQSSHKIRIQYNFDSRYYKNFEGRRDDYLLEASPDLPATVVFDLFDT